MDETWVNQNHCTDYMWLPNDGYDTPKIPSGKGKRLIVLHACTRSEGLIDGCDLVFLAKSKDGDHHQEMNSVVFLEWFENQLMPALKNPSLVVLDNASYHNVKTEDTVCQNISQKTTVLQNFLSQHNIPFSATDAKKVLYEKIKQKETPVVYITDKIANIQVLRTPVRHYELNPIELIWAQVKGFVAKNNTIFRLKDVKELTYAAFGKIKKMCGQKQKNVWSKLKKNTAKKTV
jgi:transposase